jgi:hypothetical protein
MSEAAADKPPLPLDEVAAAGLALAAEPDLAGVGRRLRERLESWAAPSLVLCIERDAGSDGGWRTVPELSSGTASAGVERTLARMIEEAPAGTLARPTLLRTEVTAANVRPRDNVIVPWSWSGSSGYLVLRGVPRPVPANLAEAVALACLPVWPLLRAAAASAPPAPAPAAEAGDASRQELEALGRKNATLQKARAAAEAERDRAESEAAELRDRVEALERQIERGEAERRVLDASRDAAARSDAALLARRLQELEAARQELAGVRQELEGVRRDQTQGVEHAGATEAERTDLRAKLEAGGAEREALERERDQARAECSALSASLESLERRLSDERRRFEAESASAAEERTAAAAEREERMLREAREEERSALQAELARIRSENNMLYASIESWERQLREQAARFETERQGLAERNTQLERRAAEADEQRAGADAGRAAAEAELGSATERAAQAEAARSALSERWDTAVASFRAALDALRRTPFVPPTLRVSMAGAQGAVGSDAASAPAAQTAIRVLLLDRDTPGLDSLAGELEQEGHEVLVAHYPEEVSFFLKTSEAKRVAAAVCDVMAFRGDQDLIEAFRAWRHDLPGLALFLSFKADNPSEAERARRVPSVLTAGYLKRPLASGALRDSLAALGRRSASRS